LRTDILKIENKEMWDLLISAKWINEKNEQDKQKRIFEELVKRFKGEGIANFLQKLVINNYDDEFVNKFTERVGNLEHESGVIKEGILINKDLTIRKALVVTSKFLGK
jgi:predicted RNA-binding protein